MEKRVEKDGERKVEMEEIDRRYRKMEMIERKTEWRQRRGN